jgi:hypothetical protein
MPEIRFLEGRGYLSPSPRGVTLPAVGWPLRQSATATPDILQMAEESLMMPCQPDKTSSVAGRHMGAAQWARNLLHVKEETLLTSSRTMAPLDDEATHIEQVAFQRVLEMLDASPIVKVEAVDRIACHSTTCMTIYWLHDHMTTWSHYSSMQFSNLRMQ